MPGWMEGKGSGVRLALLDRSRRISAAGLTLTRIQDSRIRGIQRQPSQVPGKVRATV